MQDFEFKHGADTTIEDERNWKHETINAPLLPIKGECKLGRYKPSDILMQNKIGKCTAICITQQAQKKYGKKYSSDFQYLLQKKFYDTAWYEGSSGQAALWVANKYGFLPYEFMPDLNDANPSISYSEYIEKLQAYTDEQINDLISKCENKIGGYAQVNVNDKNALAQAILDSDTGLYTTVTVTEDWYKNSKGNGDWSYDGLCPLSKNYPVAGGHAITIDTYDFTQYSQFSWANTWSGVWCWRNNYQADGGVAVSNYTTVKPNQAWIVYWDKVVKPEVKFVFNKDLKYGMTNEDVKQLQIRLGVTPQTGYFGDKTLLAVTKYQKENNIPTTGYVGKLTRASLNKIATATTTMTNFTFRWDKFLTITGSALLIYIATNLGNINWTKAGLASAGIALVQFVAQALVKGLNN